MTTWTLDVLIPTWRLAFALQGEEIVELRAASTSGTFSAYRRLPDAAPGMIAWPNVVLLTGPEPIVVDPGYQTQGDLLVGALAAHDLAPDDVSTVIMTHLHSDHVSALPQLGEVDLWVHADELATPHARRQRGVLDDVRVHELSGDSGEIRPGIGWIHTPGHTAGHIAVTVDTTEGLAVVAGDTLGPHPEWFARMFLPAEFPDRDAHLAAFRAIRALEPRLVVPGHTPPVRM